MNQKNVTKKKCFPRAIVRRTSIFLISSLAYSREFQPRFLSASSATNKTIDKWAWKNVSKQVRRMEDEEQKRKMLERQRLREIEQRRIRAKENWARIKGRQSNSG
jgi:hypothetical protein